MVSLITSGLFDDFPKLQFIFTEAGTAFIKPLVQWLDKVLETPPLDYDDQEDPLNTRGPLSKTGERLRRARAINPAHISRKNRKPANYYFQNNFYFTIETGGAGAL